MKQYLEKAKQELQNIYGNITNMQSQYKKDLLSYFLDSGKISDFTRKVLPKSRSAPSTHSLIWDSNINDFRTCIDESEEMIATSEFHGKWMGNTSAPEVCAYAKLTRKGRLGCRGIKLSPNRKVSKKDLDTLLPNHKKLSKKIKKSFLAAHDTHTASLFNEPEKDCQELFYPFYLTSEFGDMNKDDNFVKNFWKGLARIPGKARYEGFQMSVIGRLGSRWGKVLLDITKLILITRFMPPELRKMARFPIPKPGKSNEYRPISLCNDLYCYVNAISTSYSSLGIEKADILHNGMCAYRKGRGCSSLVTTELCFREDCREHNLPVLQIDEDEEIFFDRVPVEILLAAMWINGFPNQGFLELKASSMQEKLVEIITSKGIAHAKFVCGLEQGNPDSPTVSNLVIKLKHDIWQYMTAEASKKLKGTNSDEGKYVFQTVDQEDGPVRLCRIGYCDDNTKFCCTENENDLIYLAKYFLQLSGDLSMVTKIGRKSSKCELQFFNVSAEFAHNIQKCWSTAWSYVGDGPREESVPIKINMKTNEKRKLYDIIDYFNLNEESQANWDKVIHAKAHKHLGLKCTLSGDASASGEETLSKISERITTLKLSNMNTEAQRKCVNMLCSTMHSFVPLQVGYEAKDLADIDSTISSHLLKRNGLTVSDCRHRIYLPEVDGGLGFISLADQDIISVSRELEIISNLSILEGQAFRTRIRAMPEYNEEDIENIINHARHSINKLAGYGIFFQDKNDDIINNIVAALNEEGRFASIGTAYYKGGNKYQIGAGKIRNSQIAYGGQIHNILKKLQHNKWQMTEDIECKMKTCHIAKNVILDKVKNIRFDRFMNIATIFSFWEWVNDRDFSLRSVSNNVKDWKFVDIPSLLQQKFPKSFLTFDDARIKKEAKILVEMQSWNEMSNGKGCQFNDYNKYHCIMKKIVNSGTPLLISTDGAHDLPYETSDDTKKRTTSAFVISICDVKNSESLETGEWINRTTIPLLCRASKLPHFIGTTPSDIATGELFAFAMSELAIHQKLPRIILTDSKSSRDLLLELRDNGQERIINREYIRKIAGGVSKFIFNLFQDKFLDKSSESIIPIPDQIRLPLQTALQHMCATASSWTDIKMKDIQDNRDKVSAKVWEREYWECHKHRSVWKINSHQLNDEGTAINSTPRYQNLVPNLCLLSCNHHADVSADYVKKFQQNTLNIKVSYSKLRFSLIYDGKTIDRHVSKVVKAAIDQERLKRLKRKPTQGLLHRIIAHTTSDWSGIRNHKGLFRSLCGLSRTHSRSIYKNETYRTVCKEIRQCSTNNPAEINLLDNMHKNQDLINHLLPCMWCADDSYDSITIKGNRKHAMLHCSNNELTMFRKDLLDLTTSKLKYFCTTMMKVTSWTFVEDLLSNIAEQFDFHQQNNTGRLSKIPRSRNNMYLPIPELLQKRGVNSLRSAILNGTGDILTDIFGITQREPIANYGDDELGIIDVPWLGLTPIFLDRIINNACTKLDGMCSHTNTNEIASMELLFIWNTIKEINLGRAAGLHRIIGTTGKTIEKQFAKNANLTSNVELTPTTSSDSMITPMEIVSTPLKAINDTSNSSSPLQQSPRLSDASKVQEKNIETDNIDSPKTCTGVTCGKESTFWCAGCTYEPNLIKQSIKQCQRCGRFMTALKQAHTTMLTISPQSNVPYPSNSSTIVNFCKDNPDNLQFRYKQFMDLLDTSISIEKRSCQARHTLKSLSDRHKLICKIIHKSILHHAKKEDSTETIFDRSASFIQQTANKLNQQLLSIKTANKINIKTDPFLRHNSLIEKYSDSNKSSLSSSQAIATNCANTYLSGQAIKQAVEVIRDRHTPNVFIAHSDAYLTIESWDIRLGWNNFARIFTSQRVLDEKPMGIYMIPMFTGSTSSGHWSTIVIEKRRNCCQGWVIDSLGSSDLNRQLKEKIRRAFLPGRGRFIWTDLISRSQTECECGPRTILALHLSASIIAAGGTTARAVEEASLIHIEVTEYKAHLVRLEAALLVDEHDPSMIS